MAKITGPLLSETAHGTIGKALTFSKRASGNQARFQKKQKDYENAARELQRENYGEGIEMWRGFSDDEKRTYKTYAVKLHMTGFNLFMKNWMLGLIAITKYLLLQNSSRLLLEDGGKVELE